MIKKTLILLLLLMFSTSCYAAQYVNGYMKSNGTYVQGHYRSNSDFTRLNNYSTKGNMNPYTGQMGTSNPSPYVRTNTYRPYKSNVYKKYY